MDRRLVAFGLTLGQDLLDLGHVAQTTLARGPTQAEPGMELLRRCAGEQ